MKSVRILSAVLLGLLAVATAFAQSQSAGSKPKPPATKPSGQQGQQDMMGGKMMEHCQTMMAERQQMQAEMKAMDAELDELVAAMNRAPENKKADAVGAVVAKMVEQRKAMHEKIETMQMQMMQHMMEHMQMSKESMKQCPMMKGMMSGSSM